MINYLSEAYKRYLVESVSPDKVRNAILNRERVLINYRSNGEDKNNGARVIEVYAYGLTRKGNPVIRAFQNYGDTTRTVPNWKFFRLDRITSWKPTGQTFDTPANKRYKGLGPFNREDDKTMSTVYLIANFDDVKPMSKRQRNFASLKKQLENPIYISQIRDKYGYVGAKETSKNQGAVKGDEYTKGQQSAEKLKAQYGGDISSRFVSNAEIKKKLGYDENEPETDEMRKRIQMERDWMNVTKKNLRKARDYYDDGKSFDNQFTKDSSGEKAMKKLSSLANLKNRPNYTAGDFDEEED